jgi:hypothetical protein
MFEWLWHRHRHRFDGNWKEVSRIDVLRRVTSFGASIEEPRYVGQQVVYSNTCTECGDLCFRRFNQIE